LVEAFGIMTLLYGLSLAVTLPWTIPGSSPDATGAEIILRFVFAANFALTIGRWLLFTAAAFWQFRHLPELEMPADAPLVSILVPAHNEAETMEAALASIVGLRYPAFEVIVIDDGSTDDTLAIARAFAQRREGATVRVLAKSNGGKWSALNHGFAAARGELIMCVDADTRLHPESLRYAVARIMSDDTIGAIAGQVTVRNRETFLGRMQAIEYVLGNGGTRMAQSAAGLVTVVPGAIGLFRRDVLHEVARASGLAGPWSGETFAEDFQASLTVLALGYRVVYEPRAIAYTKGPDRIDTLLNQRYRWMRGTWQVLSVFRRTLRAKAKVKNPRLRWIMAACYSIDVYCNPVINFLFWGWCVLMLATSANPGAMLMILATILMLNLMTAVICAIVQNDDLRLAPYAVLLDVYQAIFINSAWVIAAVDEVRGTRMKWH
jgi:cellulose synthase/poly-beta-1,6-N-acetylglucosamine synthase-like glycosyltransferase